MFTRSSGSSNSRMIWFDLETTGFNIFRDSIYILILYNVFPCKRIILLEIEKMNCFYIKSHHYKYHTILLAFWQES